MFRLGEIVWRSILPRIISVLFAGLWSLAPLGLTIGASPSQASSPQDEGYEYIVDAEDGTLYFAKVETKIAGTVVIKMRVINDPDSEDKDYTLIKAFKCRERLVKDDGQWNPVPKSSVGAYMLDFAC